MEIQATVRLHAHLHTYAPESADGTSTAHRHCPKFQGRGVPSLWRRETSTAPRGRRGSCCGALLLDGV